MGRRLLYGGCIDIDSGTDSHFGNTDSAIQSEKVPEIIISRVG